MLLTLSSLFASLVLPVMFAALAGGLPVCAFLLLCGLVLEVASEVGTDADAHGAALLVSTSAGMADRADARHAWTAEADARADRTIARFADRGLCALPCVEDEDGRGAEAMRAEEGPTVRAVMAAYRSRRIRAAGAAVVIRAGRPARVTGPYGDVSGRGRFATVRGWAAAPVGLCVVDNDEWVAVASGHLPGVDCVARDLAAAERFEADEAIGFW